MKTVLGGYGWEGTNGRLAHHLALVMLCLTQCLIVWIVVRCVAPVGM